MRNVSFVSLLLLDVVAAYFGFVQQQKKRRKDISEKETKARNIET